MVSLWNEITAAEATGGEARGLWHASRVEIDSRKVKLGDLFVAIKGERVDGHQYVADALSRGAVAAIVSHVPENLPRSASLLVVKDTMEALVALAKAGRARSNGRIVGVTGSVGKTSTKEMLKLALSIHGKTYATTGNYNNHIGTPLNLANLPADATFGVFEMGMNHEGEIRYLTHMVRPHVAVITNIEAVHLEFFKNIEAIADAKREIFEGVEKRGAAVLPADNTYGEYLRTEAAKRNITTLMFGEKEGSDAQLMSYQARTKGAEAMVRIEGQIISFSLAATGKHWAQTAACALAVAHALKLPLPKTAAALADFSEVDGRGKVLAIPVAGGSAWLIDDSYNASPTSMKAAIAKADEVWQLQGKKGRKIAALGEMLELGPQGPNLHAALAQTLVDSGFHRLYCSGALMQHLYSAVPASMQCAHMMTAAQLLPVLQKNLAADDVVLVKGSHGSKMYELAGALANPAAKAN